MSMPPMDFKAIQKRMQENLGYNQATGTTKYSPMSASQASAGASGGTTGGVIPKIATEANKVLDKPFAGTGATQGLSASMAKSGVTQGMSKGAGTGATLGSIPPIKPTYNEQATTNYGSGALGGILSAKKYYDTGVANNNSGLKGWAANSANQYYGQLGADEATQVKGMNTQQLINYINEKNKGKVEDPTTITDPAIPEQPPVDYLALARAELERGLAERRSAADQAKAGLKSEWDRSNEMLGEGRTMDRLWLDRNASPFTGQTLDKKDNLAREWSQADEASLNRYNQNIAGIESGYTDYANTLEDQITARAYELEQQALGNARADAGITGVYNGAPTRSAMESDRAFNYNVGQDNLAASQWAQTFEEDKKRYGEETAYKKARDKITDAQDKRDFDEQVRQNGISAAVSWYNAKTSSANAATSAASLAWSKDPNNPDNIYKNKQIEELNNPKLSDHEIEANLISGLDTLTPSERKNALLGEKSNIIKQFGKSYYDSLYKSYFPDEE